MIKNLKAKEIFLRSIIFLIAIFVFSFVSTNFAHATNSFSDSVDIQKTLNQVLIPSPNLKIDGILGSKSIAAIKTFQASKNLKVDGIVGFRTHLSLREAGIKENIKIQITLNQVLIPSPEIKIDGVLGDNSIAAIKTFQASKNLKVDGIIGPATRGFLRETQLEEFAKIQIALNANLIPSPNLKIDGILGNKSIAAIKTFQASKNLKVDGIFGPLTSNAFKNIQLTSIVAPISTLPNINNVIVKGGGGGGSHIDPNLKSINSFRFNSLDPVSIGVVNESAHTIILSVPFNTNVTNLVPSISYSGKSISPASEIAQDFSGGVIYTVTASNDTTQAYLVTVNVLPPSSIATVTSSTYSINNVGSSGTINGVPYNTSKTNFIASLTKGESHQTWDESNINDPVVTGDTLIVTAEDGTTQVTYTITAFLNPAKDITSFNFESFDPDVIGVISGTDITLNVPFGTDVTDLTPTITLSGGTVSPLSGVSRNFSSPVTYTVTDANNDTKIYTVTVTSELNSTKAITAFNFTSPVVTGIIDEGAHTIALTVPFGTSVVALIPSITHTGASISPASGVAKDFSSSVIYTVTADNGSTQIYTVTVTVAPNNAKAITAFNFTSPAVTGIIDEGAHAISLAVPYSTNVTSLIPSITHTGASVSPASGVANDFSTTQTYRVTALDTTFQDYQVTVTKNPASSIATVASTLYTVNNVGSAGTITSVPYGTSKATFEANLTKGESHQSWNDTGIHSTVLTNDTLVVTAEDGSTIITYTITVVPIISGTISIDGVAKFGQTLTINTSQITYTPSSPPDEDIITYQWKRNGNSIAGANSNTYILVQADIGTTIAATVTSDGKDATGSLTSNSTDVVAKADGPVAPSAPTLQSKTSTSVTLTPNALNQFNVDNGTWQDSNTFNSLNPSTTYTFKARVKETSTTNPSLASTGLSVTTDSSTPATTPASIHLTIGSTAGVLRVTDVQIPVSGGTDTTGIAGGWATSTHDKIKFTVIDGGNAHSMITIGGVSYTSGNNYTIPSSSSLTIIVTTTETNRETCVRTFTIAVEPVSNDAKVTSGSYTISTTVNSSSITGSAETILNVPTGTTKTAFKSNLTKNAYATWIDTGLSTTIKTGDALKVTAEDGVTFITYTVILASDSCSVPSVSYGGMTYYTVQIGTQCWLQKNMNIGTKINNSELQTNNTSIEKYCYNDDEINCNTYGGLYQWDEAMQYVTTEGAQGICPAGWHIPTNSDFDTLGTYLGGASVNGNKMKEIGTSHWSSAVSSNTSGFTGLPSGNSIREQGGVSVTPYFSSIFSTAVFNTSTLNGSWPHIYTLGAGAEYLGHYYGYKSTGEAIRCIKDPTLTAPNAPTIGTATAGDTQATVTFTAPTYNGGSSIIDYTVTSSPGSLTATGVTSPITVSGLTNGETYTFTVVARNAIGTGSASSASNSVTPHIITVPDAPTGVSATAGDTQATVTFTAPTNDGGSSITGYTVTSIPSGGIDNNAGTTGLSHTVTGLTNGTPYTFTVIATNVLGNSLPSTASNSVTPNLIVGSSYGGGKVAYIFQSGDSGYVAGEVHGLISSLSDQGTGTWGVAPCYGTNITGADGTAIGTGHQNTLDMIAASCTNLAQLVYGLDLGGGYTDWYIPSKDELNKLYLNKTSSGVTFSQAFYISSSEYNESNAWVQSFSAGAQSNIAKNTTFFKVRAVRSF